MEKIIIPIAFIFASFFVGLSLWKRAEKIEALKIIDLIASSVVGSAVMTTIIFWLAFITGALTIELIGTVLILSLSLGYLDNQKCLNLSHIKFRSKATLAGIILTLISLSLAFLFRNLLFFENGNLMAGWITIWGDWAAHIAYATNFAFGNNFPPELPIFAGHIFSYPFLADFLSAILLKSGVNIPGSFVFPQIIFSIMGAVLLAWLYNSLSKNWAISLTSLFIFLLNGGLGFVYFLSGDQAGTTMTQIANHNIQWAEILTTQFAPQRSFVFGFPLGIIIIYLLSQIYLKSQKTVIYLITGFLISLLPLIHMHTFLIVCLLASWIFISKIKSFKSWVIFSLPIVFLAIPVIFHFYFGTTKGFICFDPGWMAQDLASWPLFALNNFGLMLALPILGLLTLDRKLKIFFLPFLGFFLIGNLFVFQPWDWDNTKIFIYWNIGAAFLSGSLLFWLVKRFKSKGIIAASLLFAFCTISGAHDVLQLLTNKETHQLFSKQQIIVGDYIRNHTNPSSIFLTADNHDNLVTNLGGRKSLLIFPGWLWSYGIDFNARKGDIEIIKAGGTEARKLITKYKIDYILLGPAEKNQNFNAHFFISTYEEVYKNGDYKIIKTSGRGERN